MARTRGKPMSPRAQRRADARARAKARARRVPLRRRLPRPLRTGRFWAVVVLLAAVAGSGITWDRVRLVPLPAEPGPLPAADVESYRVVYSIRDTADASQENLTTEVVEVRRPFASRIETLDGPPPGGEILSGSVTNRDFFWNLKQGGEVQFGLRRQPGTAHRDSSTLVLEEALSDVAAERRGSGRVLDRDCVVFAFLNPRPQPMEPPTDEESVETCVTESGIVLREIWRLDGRVVIRREAVELDIATDIPDERFRIGEEPDPEAEENRLIAQSQVVNEDGPFEGVLLVPVLPEGFRRDRTAVHFDSGGGQAPPRNTHYRSFVRGGEVVVVDQGTARSGSPPWRPEEGTPLRLAREWEAHIVYVPDHVEVRVWRATGGDLPETRFLRVQAPSRDLAVWFAKTSL